MFGLKQFLGYLLSPLPLGLLLLFAGIILSFAWRKVLARCCLLFGFLCILVASVPILTSEKLRAAQYVHPPLTDLSTYLEDTPPTNRWIAVLGTGFKADSFYPSNSQIDSGFLARIIEGQRLLQACPGSRMILFLPGDAADEIKNAWLDTFAPVIGLDRARVHLITEVRDTAEEAEKTRTIVHEGPVLVVTAAPYMVRAVETFTTAGLQPVPAPCGFSLSRKKPGDGIRMHQVLPSPGGLYGAQLVIHEWLGTTWQKLTR